MKTVDKNVRFIISLVVLLFVQAVSQNNFKTIASPELIFETLALNRDLPTVAKPKYLSPADLVVSTDKSKLFVAEQSAKKIAVINVADNTVLKQISMPNEVTGIAVSNDGTTLFATITSELWPQGYVCVADVASGKVNKKIKVGHSPRSPVLNPDGSLLYVCNQFDNDISVVDIASGKETKRIDVVREPYCARITPNGSILVVANSLPLADATDSSAVHCTISLIDLRDESKTVQVGLPQGSNSALGVAITPDGKYALITHLVAMYTLPATQIIGGHVHTNNLAIIDMTKKALLNDFSLDYSNSTGCANPWDVETTADGAYVVVAHAGSNELSIVDLVQLIKKADTTKWYSHNFTLLQPETIRKRIEVQGKHPRSLAIVGSKVYTAGYFSNTYEVFPIEFSTPGSFATISLGPELPLTEERQGEYHFYNGDENHCQGAWQSCHSCHSFTRADGLDWMLAAGVNLNKNTKSLLYAWWTPPLKWAAKRGTCSEAIKYSIIQELGMTASDSVVNTIGEFVKRLKPLPSPHLEKGCLSAAAKRGRDIYYGNKTDCKVCHPAPLLTDQKLHTSIVPDTWDASPDFDTPQIQEAWRSAPWDHIGTTTDFETLLKNPSHSNCGKSLSESEFKDLMEYVFSL